MSTEDRIICTDCGRGNDATNSMLSALLSKQDTCGQSAMWNNPFVYLVWMALFGGNGFGFNRDNGENFNSRQIAALQDSVNTNHNNDLAMQAISGNRDAIVQLSSTMNCSFAQMQQAICTVKSAIESVSGQVGYSAESVKNAILLGDQNIMSKMTDCCCQQKQLTMQMGYEAQLRDQQNTSDIIRRMDQMAQRITEGFSASNYERQRSENNVIAAGNANTQRILDSLNGHWVQELQTKYQDAKLELSQQNQNLYLLSQLKPAAVTPTTTPAT